jgi:hypothetical protein
MMSFALLCLSFGGCREEPTIVIKFEANDLAPPVRIADLSAPADVGVAKKPATPKTNECASARDCVVEPTDCCDCANGGKQHAIARKDAAVATAARARRCQHTVCTMMFSTDPTCGQRADCVRGACVLVPK